MNEKKKTISIERLPEDLKMIAEILSVETALEICRGLGGMRIYIPKIESVLRCSRDNQIRFEFNGRNHKQLSRKYNLTETQIRTIVQTRIKSS